jgi:hypothetical protein
MNRLFSALVCTCFTAISVAQEANPWAEVLQAVSYAETAKASFEKGCKIEGTNQNPSYLILCPKLSQIPNSVIERAAEPFLKEHLSESIAMQAKEFWLTPKGKMLRKKIIVEIKTGRFNQLTQADLKELDSANKTSYGQALLTFSKNAAANRAVARAMLQYEP